MKQIYKIVIPICSHDRSYRNSYSQHDFTYIGGEEDGIVHIETYLNILKFVKLFKEVILNLVVYTCEQYP